MHKNFTSMIRSFLILSALTLCAITTLAQNNPIVGNWKTVDDKTGKSFSVVKIYKHTDGLYYGKIDKMLVGPAHLKCEQCEGEDHNQPLEGLVIIRGMHEENGELHGGRVLDPENGKFYYGKIFLKDGKLVLRGSLDKRGLLGRNQTWIKAE